jgi:putative oxidoreductase
LPATFLRFIGVMECLGGLGLVLPGMLHIRTAPTRLASAGLSIIMIGAVVVTIQPMSATVAILPFVTGALALFVAYGRWRTVPLGGSRAGTR